jgi:hypothetical protein
MSNNIIQSFFYDATVIKFQSAMIICRNVSNCLQTLKTCCFKNKMDYFTAQWIIYLSYQAPPSQCILILTFFCTAESKRYIRKSSTYYVKTCSLLLFEKMRQKLELNCVMPYYVNKNLNWLWRMIFNIS